LVDVAIVLPVAGAVSTTVGATPLTEIVDAGPVPNVLVQTTVMVFAPVAIVTELVDVDVELEPFTVQVVLAGIDATPLTV